MMADTAWHREEPREVRPFFAVVKAENALDACGIQLFEAGDVLFDISFELDEIDYKKLAPVIHLSVPDPISWLPDALSPSDLKLALVARHPFLKRSEIVAEAVLSEPIPDRWPIDPEVLERLGGGRNLQLSLAVCLAADRPAIPGAPSLPGHWLARKSFLLRSRTMPTLFDLRIRTDEEWVAAGFPAKTFYAVDYLGGIDSELDEGASVATVWVHVDAHSRMVSSTLGEALQPMLGAEIISAILLESHKDWHDVGSVEPASPLATLLKQLGKEKPLTLDGLKALIGRPSLLKATLQDRLSVVAGLR